MNKRRKTFESTRNGTDLAFLSDSANHFLSFQQTGQVYHYLVKQLSRILKSVIVLVFQYDPQTRNMELRGFEGAGLLVKPILKILGRDPQGMTFPLSPPGREILLKGQVVRGPDRLEEIAEGKIPANILRKIEKLIGLKQIYFSGIMYEDDFLGEIIFLVCRRGSLGNIHTLDTFIHQGAMALQKLSIYEQWKESENLNQLAFHTTTDMIAISRGRDDVLVRVNHGFTRLTGYSPKEAQGRKIDTLGIWKDISAHRLLRQTVLENGHFNNMEVELIHRNGESWIGLISARRIMYNETPHVLSFTRNISERKKNERELKRRQKYLEGVLNSVPDAIITLDSANRLVEFNPGAEKLFRYSREEVLGKNIDDLIKGPKVSEETRRFTQMISRGKMLPPTETVRYRKDGQRVDVIVAGAPIIIDGQLSGSVGIYKDITHRKRLEEEISQSRRMESIGQLASGISHDFNNLLTIINGYSSLLVSRDHSPGKVRKLAGNIKQAGERAASLTDQLLAFSRRQAVSPRVCSVKDRLHSISNMLQRLIGEHIHLTIQSNSVEGAIRIDPSQFDQILINLSVNARDAMPDGGNLTIAAIPRTFDDEFVRKHPMARKGRYMMIQVSDTGEGMEDHVRDRVFEPFFTTKESRGGTGLGLATVYGIVRQNKGYIWLDSIPGKGSQFQVCFPRVQPSRNPEGNEEEATREGGNETILVVEDDQQVMNFIVQVLKEYHYRVISFDSPAGALKAWPEIREDIHLLLTDIVMPGMDGKQMVRKMIENGGDHLKVVFMSGYTGDVIDGKEISNMGYPLIRKPVKMDVLLQIVGETLSRDNKSSS